MMRGRWIGSCALLGPMLGGCSSGAEVREFLGEGRLALLESSDVQAYRIDHKSWGQDESPEALAGYTVTQEGPALSAAQRERFQGLVLDGGNWDFNVAKACEFMPGVALRFRDDGQEMTVLLCFSCDEWGFHFEGQTRTEDNDDARGELIALAQELFPDDPIVMGLR